MCALILEPLLNSNVDSIADLNITNNLYWFNESYQGDVHNNVVLLSELITKQAGLLKINLEGNLFCSKATKLIVTTIAEHPSTSSKLQFLDL